MFYIIVPPPHESSHLSPRAAVGHISDARGGRTRVKVASIQSWPPFIALLTRLKSSVVDQNVMKAPLPVM